MHADDVALVQSLPESIRKRIRAGEYALAKSKPVATPKPAPVLAPKAKNKGYLTESEIQQWIRDTEF